MKSICYKMYRGQGVWDTFPAAQPDDPSVYPDEGRVHPDEARACPDAATLDAQPPATNLQPPAPSPASNPNPDPPISTSNPTSNLEPLTSRFCQHLTAAGRRCRKLRALGHPSFCERHAQPRSKPLPDDEALAAELLASVDDFTTAARVNLFIGNVVRQLARKRIQRRDAIALAYLSQLLLNSLSAMEREMINGRPLLWVDRPDPEAEEHACQEHEDARQQRTTS
jgi:hypothetical protein